MSTKPGSTDADDFALTRETSLFAHRLEMAVVAAMWWVWWPGAAARFEFWMRFLFLFRLSDLCVFDFFCKRDQDASKDTVRRLC